MLYGLFPANQIPNEFHSTQEQMSVFQESCSIIFVRFPSNCALSLIEFMISVSNDIKAISTSNANLACSTATESDFI